MKIAAKLPLITSFVLAAVAMGDRTAGAVSACGDRQFGNTIVHECYDSEDSFTTFSNACGTQRVDAQAASHGVYPDQLVPCPRPNGGSSGNYPSHARENDISDAEDSFRRANSNFQAGDFGLASIGFADAESYYRRAGDTANAERARRNKNLSICNANIGEDNITTLHVLLGEASELEITPFAGPAGAPEPASTSRRGACAEFPAAVARVRSKIAALEQPAREKREADEAPARQRAAAEEAARQRAAEAARQRAAEEARQRAAEQEKREAAQQLAQATQTAITGGHAQAARAQNQFAANDPTNNGSQGFDAALKRAHGQQQATGPIVDAGSLRASQGTCSDLTGVGGGPGPTNCTQSGAIPAHLQAQIAQARSQTRMNSPTYANLKAAAEQYRQVEAALRAAGKLDDAAKAAEEALALEDLAGPAPKTSGSCPPSGPGVAPEYMDYCLHANCFERGTAYYGMLCFPDRKPARTPDEQRRFCEERLAALKARGLDKPGIKIQMCRGDRQTSCQEDGRPMTFPQAVQCKSRLPDGLLQ